MDYDSIVEENIGAVYRLALSYCRNKADAEDVVQNTFARLLETKTDFQDQGHVKRWLMRVAVNESKNLLKSFWKKNVSSIEVLKTEPEGRMQENIDFIDQIYKLPPKYRVVIHLYYFEGYRVQEIADILNISKSNVQVRLLRARNRLKNQMGGQLYE